MITTVKNIDKSFFSDMYCTNQYVMKAIINKVETMLDKCPGTSFLRTPTLKVKYCPECGNEVEVFSTDVKVKCNNCGFVVYNNVESCIQWCRHAKDCVGEEIYEKQKRNSWRHSEKSMIKT